MLVDWRTLLGVSAHDQVLCIGTGAERMRRALTPWLALQDARNRRPVPHPGRLDWVICGDPLHVDPDTTRGETWTAHVESLRQVLQCLRPGGHVAMRVYNRWGLHGVLGLQRRSPQELHGARDRIYSLRGWHRLMGAAGADDIRSYALLPHPDAPRVVLPIQPACPAAAQKFVIDQVWKRPTRAGTLGRTLLGVFAHLRLMPHLYPYYLLVGRNPC
jgi:SAM-dependent methyltransferase